MTNCCVYRCTNNPNKNKDLSFHSFPNKKTRGKIYKLWLLKINRDRFKPSNRSVICSAHFVETDYETTSILRKKLMPNYRNKLVLKKDAVPSVGMRGESDLQTQEQSRRQSNYQKMKETTERSQIVNEIIHQMEGIDDGNEELDKSVLNHVDCGVQCELGTETNENTVKNYIVENKREETENGRKIDASVQCELGIEVFRNQEIKLDRSSFYDSNDEYEASSSFDSDDSSGDEDEDMNPFMFKNSSHYIIKYELLFPLFERCQTCGGTNIIVKPAHKGLTLIVKMECANEHKSTWKSQPVINRQSIGNVDAAAAMYCTGLNFTTFETFADTLDMKFMSHTTYYKIINKYVAPAVRDTYDQEKRNMFEQLKSNENLNTWICGDAQFDSPGYSAKYATYSVMNLRTEEILDFELVQKGQVQGELEKAACDKLLTRLDNEQLKISLFLSDRHRGIRLLVRTKFSHIDHQFDVWHMAKNLAKKLKGAEGKASNIGAWKSSIINHLWWSSQTCGTDKKVLEEKFKSIMNHICNIHEWDSSEEFSEVLKCSHDPLPPEKLENTLWISKNSPDYYRLSEILNNKTFINDLKQTNQYCHTGALESYHNVRLKYTPKRLHFTYEGMKIRSMLAVMDHNNSVRLKNKELRKDRQRFSKSLKQWVYVSVSAYRKPNIWRRNLVNKIRLIAEGQLELPPVEGTCENIPDNIALVPRPCIETTKKRHFSRLEKAKH